MGASLTSSRSVVSALSFTTLQRPSLRASRGTPWSSEQGRGAVVRTQALRWRSTTALLRKAEASGEAVFKAVAPRSYVIRAWLGAGMADEHSCRSHGCLVLRRISFVFRAADIFDCESASLFLCRFSMF